MTDEFLVGMSYATQAIAVAACLIMLAISRISARRGDLAMTISSNAVALIAVLLFFSMFWVRHGLQT